MHKNQIYDIYLEKIKFFSEREDALINSIRNSFPSDTWKLSHHTKWFSVTHESGIKLTQGWKIHISATKHTALEVLNRVIPILLVEKSSFKIASNLMIVGIMNEAHYPREHSGKFITIYPNNIEIFKRLVVKCNEVTFGLRGPRILSDKPFEKGGLVHYRYGAFINKKAIDNRTGKIFDCIYDPQGNPVPDGRHAWYSKPSWVSDPFEMPDVKRNNNSSGVEYKFEQAIRHSNKGGVYIGRCVSNGRKVLIKEARPNVGTDDNSYDVTDYLKNEVRILKHLSGFKIVPEYIDFFELDNHCFLVEEFIEGNILGRHVNELKNKLDKELLSKKLRKISIDLTNLVAKCHKAGVRIRDLSKNNIIINKQGNARIIDLEYAMLTDDKVLFPGVGTLGYVEPSRDRDNPSYHDDLFSLGCILFYIYTGKDPVYMQDDSGYKYTRNTYQKIRDEVHVYCELKLLDLPIGDVIIGLTNFDRDKRYTLEDVINILEEKVVHQYDFGNSYSYKEYKSASKEVVSHLMSRIDCSNPKELWKRTTYGSTTSPINIQNGAAGVGIFVSNGIRSNLFGEKELDLLRSVTQWVYTNYEDYKSMPPPGEEYSGAEFSLYFSGWGSLWFLLDASILLKDSHLRDEIINKALSMPEKSPYSDIVLGTAGFGMACLHFWSITGNQTFLKKAIKSADHLCENLEEVDGSISWPIYNKRDGSKKTFWGYGHGNAGICHFLLLMYKITSKAIYLNTTLRGYDTLINNAIIHNNSCSWSFGPDEKTNWAHWCNGSSGIGSSLIRMYAFSRDEKYLKYAKYAATNVMERLLSSSLCQCHGLSGNAEFILDMYVFTGDIMYLRMAEKIANLIYGSRICKGGNLVFADETTMKISSDYGTGMSGVANFLLRLSTKSKRLFMNDEILLGGVNNY